MSVSRKRADGTKGSLMNDDKLPATAFKSEARDASGRTARTDGFEQTGQPPKATRVERRTVGVYERPAQRARLPLPLLVILILASLISLVLSVRFLF